MASTKNSPGFVSVLTRAGAVPVLSLREKRASNRPSVLKPFCRRLFGASQPSGPHRSRESQPSVKPEPPPIPFSSLLPPHREAVDAPPCRGARTGHAAAGAGRTGSGIAGLHARALLRSFFAPLCPCDSAAMRDESCWKRHAGERRKPFPGIFS